MKNAGWDRHDSHANSQNNQLIGVAKRVLWLRLPPSVRQYCQLQKLSFYKNVKELASAVNRYPGTPPDLDKIADDGQTDCEVISVKCLYHPQTSHSATQCTYYLNSVKEYHSKKRGFSDSVDYAEKKVKNASAKVGAPQLNSNAYQKVNSNRFPINKQTQAVPGTCFICKTQGWTKEKKCVNPNCGKPSPRLAGAKAGNDDTSTPSASYEDFFTSIKCSSHYFNSSSYMNFINENPLINTNPSGANCLATNKANRHILPGEEKFSMVPVPLLLNGHKVIACLDTGSSHSYVSPKLVEELKINWQSSIVKVSLAEINTSSQTPQNVVPSMKRKLIQSIEKILTPKP
jgi:hypothetical protein